MNQFIECFSKEKADQIQTLEKDLENQNQNIVRNQSTIHSIQFDLNKIQEKLIEQYYDKAIELEKMFTQIDSTYEQLNLLETKLKNMLK